MKTWWEFVQSQKNIDEKQIDALYDKAHIAVELVRWYKPELLENIASIANLASGAYGVYNSGENRKLLPKPIEQRMLYYGKVNRHNLDMIPKSTLRKYFPDVPEDQIQDSDTIHINIRRIVNEFQGDLERVLEIAATIVHETTHEIERETQGWTSEAGPQAAEKEFMNWAKNNMKQIMAKYPELGHSKPMNGSQGLGLNYGLQASKPPQDFTQPGMNATQPNPAIN